MYLFQFTSKLNFPSNRPIFTDLPTLEDPIEPPSADHLIQRASAATSKIKEKSKKSQEVGDLITKLVALEYQNEELNRKERSNSLPNEDELLGFSKFKELKHTVSNKKDQEDFERKVQEDLHHSLFARENYLNFDVQFDPDRKSRVNGCNCLKSKKYYDGHSKCS